LACQEHNWRKQVITRFDPAPQHFEWNEDFATTELRPKLPPLSCLRRSGLCRAIRLDAAAKLLNLGGYLLNQFWRFRDFGDTTDLLKPISRKGQMAIKVVNRPDIIAA